MELPEQAARALAVVRRDGTDLRYTVDGVCGSSRYRLSVRYRAAAGDEIRLGLLWSEDREGLEALGRMLAG